MSQLSVPTPHINAPKDASAKTVLMPGDPKRAKLIVDTYLNNSVLVNDIVVFKVIQENTKVKKFE